MDNPYSPNILRSKGARKRGDLTTAIFIKPSLSLRFISFSALAKTTGRAAEKTHPQLCKSGAPAPFNYPRLPLTVYENRRCVTDPP